MRTDHIAPLIGRRWFGRTPRTGAAYLSQDGRFGVWGKIRANGAAL
jgi:hypothetical protein